MTHPVQQTSLEAFEEIKASLGKRQRQVYLKLKELGSATNCMLAEALKLPINSITPRVYELRKLRLVGVSEVGYCKVTGRKAIYWKCVK
ncbi:MAG: hypothetical protein ACTSU6_06740 [Candidatus Njordarchaeales archaeon]